MSELLVCCVGTTEPWTVAGLGLDIRALDALGARGVIVVAGVSAQDGRGAHAGAATEPGLIAAQFAALERAPISAVRIGALLDPASIGAVARALRIRVEASGPVPIVYDPVLATSAGGRFASPESIVEIVRELVPLTTTITPNLAEAAWLLGLEPLAACEPDPQAMACWGASLVAAGAGSALVTGGHLAGDPIDVLVDGDTQTRFAATRLPGELRGTGCLLACALAVGLGRGDALRDAVASARAFVRARFAAARDIAGMRAAY